MHKSRPRQAPADELCTASRSADLVTPDKWLSRTSRPTSFSTFFGYNESFGGPEPFPESSCRPHHSYARQKYNGTQSPARPAQGLLADRP